ncbi:MAG: hypothetical protein ACPH5J_06715 [Candidatus Puniceispirillum sp.]
MIPIAKDTKKAKSSKTENTEIDETLVPSAPSREVKEGELVWYNERKGYGFVKIDDIEIFCTDQRLIALAWYAS